MYLCMHLHPHFKYFLRIVVISRCGITGLNGVNVLSFFIYTIRLLSGEIRALYSPATGRDDCHLNSYQWIYPFYLFAT